MAACPSGKRGAGAISYEEQGIPWVRQRWQISTKVHALGCPRAGAGPFEDAGL